MRTQKRSTWKLDPEKNSGPSLTIPDQTMSIQEILNRYARGIPMDDMKTPVYNEGYVPDLEKMDYFDKQMLKDEITAKADQLGFEAYAELESAKRTRTKKTTKTDSSNEQESPGEQSPIE